MGRPRIDTARTSMLEQRECFVKAIDEALENFFTDCATARWDFIRDTVYKAAIDTFGKRAKNNED